ncbi:MAG TPA: hypothetical protein VI011_02620 [Asanoa sp.]
MRYAWIYTLNHPTGGPPVDAVTDGYLLEEIGRSRATLVSLWPSIEAVRTASAAVGVPRGTVVRDEIYQVRHELHGPDPAARPAAATLLDFDGPTSPARVAAAERAFTHRIRPLMERLDGCVRAFVLWQPATGAQVVLGVTDSLEALRRIGRAVTTAPLLPGEDAALLPGPDRAAIHTVTFSYEGALR